MTYPGRVFHRPAPPTKAGQRCDVMLIILQRTAAGLDFPAYLVASMARSHGMSVGEVEGMIAAEIERRRNVA